jgi:hypothetical protein
MINYKESSLRPNVSPCQAINHCLEQITTDTSLCLEDKVAANLTYEELVGALMFGRDLVNEQLLELEWAEGKYDEVIFKEA